LFLYNIIDIPEAPLNFGATEVFAQIPEYDCEILVKWDPPANSDDIAHYIIYVSPPNTIVNVTSFIFSLLLKDCPESLGIKVAAVNLFGCIGINSSEVHVHVTLQPTSTSESPESSK
jgi:hypothetical protein